ncbi:hypothetical protein [Bordetella sp. 15P40C-2]|uniref:hypothetical protein n=1 Tax=Bordetella sp. 15P40C-2 TaxID=2572246 RepID=UPI00351ABDFF
MMKTTMLGAIAAVACLTSAAAFAQAQQPAQTQQYSFPGSDGSYSPPSTLRITEQPGTPPAPAVRDTQESIALYQRCRNNADREAVDRNQLQTMVATCLAELQQRRQQ